MGWSAKRHGELLELMAAERFPQHLGAIGIGVVVVRATTDRMTEWRPPVPRLLEALSSVRAGEVLRVESDSK